jgi:thiamine kinase-like enzyme
MRDREIIYRLSKNWSAKTVRVTKAGGQTNRNYIVEHKGSKSFVRLPWESDVIDRVTEGKNILELKKNKNLRSILPGYRAYILKKKNILTPESKDIFDAPDGTMITEFIEGREFSFADFKEKKRQKMLAKMFYTFHASDARFVNTYDVFRDEIEKYRIKAQAYPFSEIADAEAAAAFKKVEKETKAELTPLKKGVPAHNDCIFQNFLVGKNGKVYLLDFEYAGLSMRGGMYYDFGFLFADNLFRKPVVTKDMFEDFLCVADKVYRQKLDRQQIYAAAAAVVVMQFWWAILRYFSVQTKKEKKYFAAYVRARAQKVEQLSNILQM